MSYKSGAWRRPPPLAEAMCCATNSHGALSPESKARQYIQSRHVLTLQKPQKLPRVDEHIDVDTAPPIYLLRGKAYDKLWDPQMAFFTSSLLRFLGDARRVPGALDSTLIIPIQDVDSYLDAPMRRVPNRR